MHQFWMVYGSGYNGIARMLKLLGHSIGTEFMETFCTKCRSIGMLPPGNLIFDFCGTMFSATVVEHDTSNGRA